jgi:hypothetical protein
MSTAEQVRHAHQLWCSFEDYDKCRCGKEVLKGTHEDHVEAEVRAAEPITLYQVIANHQFRPDGQRRGTRCTHIDCDWFVDADTSFVDMLDSYAAHVVAALTNAGKVIVSKPDPKNPTPALIEAAYIAQDDLSTTPTWAIGAAAEVIDAYIDAQHHETVHVLGHAARVAEGGEQS